MTHKTQDKSKPIISPSLATLELQKWRDTQLEDGQSYSDWSIVRIDLSNLICKQVKLDKMNFEHVALDGSKLVDCKLRDSRLSHCDLANADWRGIQISCVEMIECRMLGFSVIESKIKDCAFIQCNASLARFRFALLRAVRFEDCNLQESDFQGADLTGIEFVRCNLRNTQMSGAKLKGASLRGSNIEGLAVNAKDLEGVIVDPMQAAYLAQLFGVKVVWP